MGNSHEYGGCFGGAALGGFAIWLSSIHKIHKIHRGRPTRIQVAACLVTSRPTAMTTQSCSRRCCVTTSLCPRRHQIPSVNAHQIDQHPVNVGRHSGSKRGQGALAKEAKLMNQGKFCPRGLPLPACRHVDVAMLPDIYKQHVALSSPIANRGHLIAHSCSLLC